MDRANQTTLALGFRISEKFHARPETPIYVGFTHFTFEQLSVISGATC